MLMNLSKFKKTKLALISLAFIVSSVLCGAGANKIISLKAGQSIDIDNLKVVCEATSNTTGTLDIDTYKKSRDLIAKFCNSFYYTSDKNKCLAINAKYVEPKALEICSNLYYSNDRLKCLSTIANKVYSNEELKVAESRYYTNDKIKVLEQSGATI